ncbi:putative transcription factor C2H2 family [Arabidopsis thaliana]
MAGVSLKCGDCGTLLKSVEEAQEHAELTSHSNFAESTEAVLNLVCTTCTKPCRSKIGLVVVRSYKQISLAFLSQESSFIHAISMFHSLNCLTLRSRFDATFETFFWLCGFELIGFDLSFE